MEKPSSASNVYDIQNRLPLVSSRRTQKGFPAVGPSTRSDIKRILDEVEENTAESRSRTPSVPIDTDALRRTLPSNHPAAPQPSASFSDDEISSGRRYSLVPQPPIEEVTIDPSKSQSEAPSGRGLVLANRRTVKEAFTGLSRSVKLAINELDLFKDNNDIFLEKYRQIKSSREIVPTLINGLSTLLNGRVIDLPPQFYSVDGNNRWVIVDCTEDSLNTFFPMVYVIPYGRANSPDQNPIAIPLRIIFISNKLA